MSLIHLMNLGGANCCNYSAITTSSMFFFQVQTLGIRTRNDPGTGTSQKSPIFIKTLVIWQIQTNSALSWFSWNGRCQYMSIYVNICQYMSIYVNTCQYMSIYVNICQCMSMYVNVCQYFMNETSCAIHYLYPLVNSHFAMENHRAMKG